MWKSEESRSWRRKVEAARYLAGPTSLGTVTSRISPSHSELSLPHVLALLYFRHCTPLREVWKKRSCNDITRGAVRHKWRYWPPRCHRRQCCFPGRRAERKCLLSTAAVAAEAVTGQPSPCDRNSLPPSQCAAATTSAEMPRSVGMVFEASCGSTCPLCGALLKYQYIRTGHAAQRRDGRGTNPPSPPHTALQRHRFCILERGWPVGGGLPSLNRNAQAGGRNLPPRQTQGVTAKERAGGGAIGATDCIDGRRDGSGGGVRGDVDIE